MCSNSLACDDGTQRPDTLPSSPFDPSPRLRDDTSIHACTRTDERLGGQLHVANLRPSSIEQARLPVTAQYTCLTIIRKALRSVVASRWQTGLHPVKPDMAAPCLCARMVAAAPVPGVIMKDDAWAMSATRHATRAKVRAMALGLVYIDLSLFLSLSSPFPFSLLL